MPKAWTTPTATLAILLTTAAAHAGSVLTVTFRGTDIGDASRVDTFSDLGTDTPNLITTSGASTTIEGMLAPAAVGNGTFSYTVTTFEEAATGIPNILSLGGQQNLGVTDDGIGVVDDFGFSTDGFQAIAFAFDLSNLPTGTTLQLTSATITGTGNENPELLLGGAPTLIPTTGPSLPGAFEFTASVGLLQTLTSPSAPVFDNLSFDIGNGDVLYFINPNFFGDFRIASLSFEAVSVVPSPSAALFGAVGLIALGIRRRRRSA